MGILNQGLRIAPPEAPATGYMVLSYFYLIYACFLSFIHVCVLQAKCACNCEHVHILFRNKDKNQSSWSVASTGQITNIKIIIFCNDNFI